jgi:hypothetical protein
MLDKEVTYFVGQMTEVDVKFYEMTFLTVRTMVLSVHFPQDNMNIGRRTN